MRIIIVTHDFPPETGAPQARLSGLAAAWAADGERRHSPHWYAQPSDRGDTA